MPRRQSLPLLFLLLLLFSIAALAQDPTRYAVVAPVADMHSRASADSDVVSQALFGSGAALLEQGDGWTKVRTADNYEGWIRANELQTVATPYAAEGKVAMVESVFASLYREPDIEKHAPVITVPYASRLEITGEKQTPEGLFYSVRLPDSSTAWVQRGDVSLDPRVLTIDETIALAKRFIGLPYRWGGTSSFGFDCSGFTQMLMRRRGIEMPRDTRPQARWEGLVPVERRALKPGDLVFFGKTKEKINHTGLYIGHGQFIHATRYGTRPTVQIGTLKARPWTDQYITSRRAK